MPKRRAVANDSDSEESASQGSKRARTDDSGYDTPGPSQEAPRRRARRENIDAGNDDAGDDDDDDDANMEEDLTPDEDEEKRFEEEHEDKIRAKVLNKSKAQGGIAEMGIIEKLEMHQFMCHKYLTFTFGPQINFIIGHNGSGKSAVLSALTVALGGKATTTGRGNGLKSFIREGQHAAEVSVTIKNQGDEAYKPEEYGSSIVITRKFTKDGTSSYKICSKDGRTVSSRREELSAICDHMNIQVDNPMNILTQDSARQFLSASAPADKYKFFLRGTQLSQLSEEYSTCLENITSMQKVLVHKSEAIPDLEEALNEASARFEEARKARKQQHRLDELKKELAWSYVVDKQGELAKKMEDVESQKRRFTKLDESIAIEEAAINTATERFVDLEAQLEALGTHQALSDRRKEIQDEIKKGRSDIQNVKADEKQINDNLKNCRNLKKTLERQIADEQEKQQSNTQGKRDEANRKLEQTVAEILALTEELNEVKARKDPVEQEMRQAGNDGQSAEAERNQIRGYIEDINGQLRACDEQERNKLSPFGKNMNEVLADIDRQKWNGEKPIGPFGMYVQVKDARWAPILRIQLGGAMSSFAVTDARDRAQLVQILRRHGNQGVQIVITQKDLFDYSKGEPPERYPTVLRALSVSDPFVLRMLINSSHIESIMLAATRREADDMLLDYGRGGTAWTNDGFIVRRYSDGGGSSSVLPRMRANDVREGMFRGESMNDRRNELQRRLRTQEERHSQLNSDIDEFRRVFNDRKQEHVRVENKIKEISRRTFDLRQRRDALQEEVNEDTPVHIQAIQDEIDKCDKEIESYKAQFTDIQFQLAQLEEAQRPLIAQSDSLKKQIDAFTESATELRTQMEKEGEARVKAQKKKDWWSDKRQTEEKKLEDLQTQLATLELEFETWRDKALQYCEEYPNPRDTDIVNRDIESVTNALKERERRQGASVEEMTIEVNKKKAALDDTKKELRSMMVLNRALRNSIRVRLKKWHEFRRHIALRCKIYFAYHLSVRGYYGKVLFDHVQGTLQLKVQTDVQQATQSKEKDPRSLSGGEKSFSTICLLLSLWESIGCPIRCLDEFDVFMDAVNRRVSMKMMIDTANASDRKQYILITPQDMTNVSIGPSVRVHRMSDPERGQGVLSM